MAYQGEYLVERFGPGAAHATATDRQVLDGGLSKHPAGTVACL